MLRKLSYAIAIIVIAYSLALILVAALECIPLSKAWTGGPGACIDTLPPYTALAYVGPYPLNPCRRSSSQRGQRGHGCSHSCPPCQVYLGSTHAENTKTASAWTFYAWGRVSGVSCRLLLLSNEFRVCVFGLVRTIAIGSGTTWEDQSCTLVISMTG